MIEFILRDVDTGQTLDTRTVPGPLPDEKLSVIWRPESSDARPGQFVVEVVIDTRPLYPPEERSHVRPV